MLSPGDTVICIDVKGISPGILKLGAQYTIDKVRDRYVTVVGVALAVSHRGFYPSRFQRQSKTCIAIFTALLAQDSIRRETVPA